MKHWVLVFLIIVISFAAVTFVTCADAYRSETPDTRFTIYVDDGYEVEEYYCDEVRVGNEFLTMWECRGYEGEVEMVGGQDFDEITIEVNR